MTDHNCDAESPATPPADLARVVELLGSISEQLWSIDNQLQRMVPSIEQTEVNTRSMTPRQPW